MEKNKVTSSNHYLHENKVQMDQRFKVNNEAIKENMTGLIYNPGMGMIFLSRHKTQKP